ncbi:MAG: hypothetical protein KAT71_08200 [Gammaproteobacteria bacterium]|nr:hypothetical protein [Gammaproteobacteria bacterium]
MIKYYTFNKDQYHDIFVDRGGIRDTVVQLTPNCVMGIVGKDLGEIGTLRESLIGKKYDTMHDELPRFVETHRVLYMFSKCDRCGKLILGNSEYCSIMCYEQ